MTCQKFGRVEMNHVSGSGNRAQLALWKWQGRRVSDLLAKRTAFAADEQHRRGDFAPASLHLGPSIQHRIGQLVFGICAQVNFSILLAGPLAGNKVGL